MGRTLSINLIITPVVVYKFYAMLYGCFTSTGPLWGLADPNYIKKRRKRDKIRKKELEMYRSLTEMDKRRSYLVPMNELVPSTRRKKPNKHG